MVINNLKKLRHELGLTLQEVADMSGLCKSFIHDVENNKSQPGIEAAYKISNALSMSVYDIFTES